MTNANNLKERLLELYYGLLPDDEATHWYQQIEDNNEVASAWKEVQRRAGVIS